MRLSEDQIDDVILMEGSGNISRVKTSVKNYFHVKELKILLNMDMSVTFGTSAEFEIEDLCGTSRDRSFVTLNFENYIYFLVIGIWGFTASHK